MTAQVHVYGLQTSQGIKGAELDVEISVQKDRSCIK